MRKSIALLMLACTTLHAQDTRFSERFANPETRDAALADLVPGTQEFHFHTALAHQLAGREPEFKAAMAAWKTAMERKENPVDGEDHAVLENRQLLMDYRNDPVGSLSEIIRKLDLRFDYEKPDAAAAAQSLPTRLDPAKISEEIFMELARKNSPDKPYTRYSGARLARELDEVGSFDKDKVEWMLGNITDADHPGVVPLMDRALELNAAFKFSDDLVTKLTSSQLETLFALHPDLKYRQSFVLLYLEKLKPGSETDFKRDIRAHAAHLRKCRDFVIPLSPVFNSLKAHVLFHHLRLQQTLDNYPEDDFLAFLALPRHGHPLVRNAEESMKFPVGLSENFEKATGCPSVKNDVPLINAYLEHFLGQADSAERFAPHVKESQLRKTHARARLLTGGDTSRWATGLDAADFKELQEEIQISFPPSPDFLLEAEAAVSIPVDLKNTPDLLIRIYELDLPGHLANHGRMPDVSLDLDGLVPHMQRRVEFSQAPLIRHREAIALPELAGAGAWVVEFTSGQVSARALIRKGQLIPFIDRTATGQSVQVFDEKGNHVPTAVLTLGGESFAADATGKITIPNTSGQPVTDGTVSAGKLAERVSLGSREDKIELETRFHLEREQLLADQETKVQLRVRLTNHGHELPLDRIQNSALVLKARLAGDVIVERVIATDLKLAPTLEVPFQVPSDLRNISLALRGTVQPASSTTPQQVEDYQSFPVNQDLDGDRIASVFFSPTAEGHRLEVRGRNGEPLPSRALSLRCVREGFEDAADVEVRTDENGRVDLGTLEAIASVRVNGISSSTPEYRPLRRKVHHGELIQMPAGREIRLPLERPLATADRLHLGLLEMLDEKPVRDHHHKLAVEDGVLVVRGLDAGDYQLRMHDQKTTIRVSSGMERQGLLVSPARIMPLLIPQVPHVQVAKAENRDVTVKLSGTTPTTRVSLVGKRFLFKGWNDGDALTPFSPKLPDRLSPGFSGNEFLTHKLLDDETRYILDRRSAKTFPGSMLPRPGPLVNRWTGETMEQESYDAEDGKSGKKSAFGTGGSGGTSDSGSSKYLVGPVSDTCEFLQFPASVRFDLTPAADGTITVPLAEFEGCQFVEITAVDTFASDRTILALPPSDTPLRDRRIARTLDSASHHLATRSAAVLAKGAEASIENLLDADWRAFTTLAEAHHLLYGMTGAEALREFTFLADWPDLKEEKKLEHLQKHACHELHLFISRKDRPFFEKHVKPLLAMKSEPKFMDDYLLERDLSAYLRPYAWHRLNAAEKALLARAMPEARERVAKELSLRWQLEAPAPDVETMLFTQTLRGTDLASQDSLVMARNSGSPGGMITKTLQLPPDFMVELPSSSVGAASGPSVEDPFAMPSGVVARGPLFRKTVGERLMQYGIDFPEGSSATLSPGGKLTVTNSAYEIDKIEQLLQPLGSPDRGTAPTAPLAAGFNDIVADVPNSVGYDYFKGPVVGTSVDGIPSDPFASNGPTHGLRIGDPAISRYNVDAILNNPNRTLGKSVEGHADSAGVLYLPNKLSRIVIPRIELNDVSVQEAVDFLVQQAREHDSEPDPAKKGVRISIQNPSGWASTQRVRELRVRNIPLETALKYVCEQTRLRMVVGDSEVSLVPATESGDDSFTRTFRVSPEFLALLSESRSASDPVVASLRNQGINFAEGASASLANGILLVTNAAEELDKIAQLIEVVTPSTAHTTLVPFVEQTFRWREANYYRHSGNTDEKLIPLNRFWLDLALWDGNGPFLSASFNACHSNANEALMCLAMLDLPFKAERPEVVVDGSTLRVIAREPMLLFYKDTRRTEAIAKESLLLLRQTFSPKAEPFRTVDGEQVENTVTGDFRPGVAYSALLVVTNPTGTGRRIDLLAQIPAGSIPLGGEPATKSTTHQLEPYGVVKETLAFYFPATGEFPVYPLQVSQSGTILGHTSPRTMRVSNDPAPQDAASWGVLAVEGTDQEVLDRLAVENLDTVDLDDILWRLKNPEFFLATTKLLRERLHHSPSVSSFGFLHNDVASMRDYLENSEAATQLGSWLDSPLLDIRPRTHGDAEWQEFDPLVNSRAHAFGDNPRMEHPEAFAVYEVYLDRLKWKPALDAEDLFGQTYFLMLQDRIEEALAQFDKIDPAKLPGRLNYDYLRAVVLFHRENPQEAKAIATANLPNLPPGLWRDRFQTVIDQANEIAALDQPQGSPEATKPETAPVLDLATSANGSLIVKHRSPDKTTLRLFSVDLEVLFSKNPFLDINAGANGRPAISANSTVALEPSATETETTVEIPVHLRTGNLLVSAESPTRKVLKVLGSESLEIHRNMAERTVQVLDSATRKPLARTYIKVYSEDRDGRVAFHKDGYTDLRGKFDYLSHTGNDTSNIRRVAILASHPEKGARTEIHSR